MAELCQSVKVAYRKSTPIEESDYPGFNSSSYILKAGTVHRDGGKPLPVDILCEQDTPITLRDGTVIYVDVFRPVDKTDCPPILAWSPYGKRGSWLKNDLFENRVDVPPDWEDGLNKFEGPLPAYWVKHGYAVINTDGRGVFKSQGNIPFFGKQEAEDEYDVIEWAAAQPWANGKVGTCGTSWFAISQWFVAALNPPHLAAIAPWEGASDLYREAMVRGGIGDQPFFEGLLSHLFGENLTEDATAMVEESPLLGEYWKSKIVALENIKVPAYIVGSWTNVLHTAGTFQGWQRIASKEKWLRVHNRHEWVDFFDPQKVEDLRRFFDYYLKGIDNGWKDTPPVRLSVLNPGGTDILNRAESSFPLKREQRKTFYLDASSVATGLVVRQPPVQSARKYIPDANGTTFMLTLDRDIELAGYIKLKLWVEAIDANDMDIFAYLTKLDRFGKEVRTMLVTGHNFVGPNGRLRVSLRRLDPKKSTDSEPYHTFETKETLRPGEIVPIEVGFWPYAMKWEAGETMVLRLNGADLTRRPEFPDLPPIPTINRGMHIVHTGGTYSSYIVLPVTSEG
ncbi:hypothetical protein DFQ28_007620 [Apophysomyces sp. BC1034]|nr:hypothetical protein DFQ30_007483 [Apophysomyces sp. BC1015]KAG0176316.1 hypothetical protein DFQ29_006300 [Apophysomyces sp. BC1021]KAG0186550.1 hypothetical protein DFQ28_007620 [Apophysomyces sp. BC1034]